MRLATTFAFLLLGGHITSALIVPTGANVFRCNNNDNDASRPLLLEKSRGVADRPTKRGCTLNAVEFNYLESEEGEDAAINSRLKSLIKLCRASDEEEVADVIKEIEAQKNCRHHNKNNANVELLEVKDDYQMGEIKSNIDKTTSLQESKLDNEGEILHTFNEKKANSKADLLLKFAETNNMPYFAKSRSNDDIVRSPRSRHYLSAEDTSGEDRKVDDFLEAVHHVAVDGSLALLHGLRLEVTNALLATLSEDDTQELLHRLDRNKEEPTSESSSLSANTTAYV